MTDELDVIVEWPDADDDRDVLLRLPADPTYLRLARLVASGLAAQCDFDLSGLEDLRIAVTEACTVLMELGDGTPIELRFGLTDLGVWAEATTRASGRSRDEVSDELTERVLSVVCDRHELEVGPERAWFRLLRLVAPVMDEAAG